MVESSVIRPLTNSQRILLQRLMVEHVINDKKANEIFDNIRNRFRNICDNDNSQDDQGYLGRDLNHCLGIINGSLVPAFNLEIRTVTLPPPYDPDANDQQTEDDIVSPRQKNDSTSKRPALIRYHAVVNRSNDSAAQQHASPLSHRGIHELAFFRLVFEKLVERGMEAIEEESDGNNIVGCPGVFNRMDLINMRMELEGAHKDKLSVGQTEAALEMLEREGWLVPMAPPLATDEEDDENDDDEGDSVEEERPKKKRKRKRKSFAGGSRRKSLRGTFYGIGPRSFMELGAFLQSLGFPQDKLPQSILHRA